MFSNFLLFFGKQYGLTVHCVYLDLYTPNFLTLKGIDTILNLGSIFTYFGVLRINAF